jgi:uncharacterized membrane protein
MARLKASWVVRTRPSLTVPIVLGGLTLVVVLAEVQLVGAAFALAGLNQVTAGLVLLGSLAGSAVNLPIARLATGRTEVVFRAVRADGLSYRIPVGVPGLTVVAVNLGGCVIPAAVSVYLAARDDLWLASVIGVSAVAVVVHLAARPVPEVGIVLPAFLPAVLAASVAMLIHPAGATAALAYIAGTLGTLVGADITNLPAIRRMRAPMVSIGGAGTFDGVFVAGIFAVLLAAIL